MQDGRTFEYNTTGDFNGKIAAYHPLFSDSVVTIGRNKYRVQGCPTPTLESKLETVHLIVIEIHAVQIG